MTRRVEVSLALRNYADDPGDWSWFFDAVTAAEEAGFDRVLVSDHVVMGEHLDEYSDPAVGGWTGMRQPTGPDGHFLEPLTLLSFLAARTRRLRLGTSVVLAPLRNAVVLAKVAATLDVLSGGRLDLGVGVGWQADEYRAVGVPFESRGQRLDECLEVCQLLWREPVATYSGPTLSFERVHQMPKPVQPGGVPIWVSGRLNKAVVRRLARFGSGWIPWGMTADEFPGAIRRMREAVADQGRNPDEIGVVGSLGAQPFDDAQALQDAAAAVIEAGATDVRVPARIPEGRAAAVDHLHELRSRLPV